MGRPIQSKWFGIAPVAPGFPPYTPDEVPGVIQVNGIKFSDGTTFGPTPVGTAAGYIIKQTGSTAYVVQDESLTHAAEILFMVNATTLAALEPGQCFILGQPFNSSPLPCSKISQFRVSLYDVPNATTPGPVDGPQAGTVSNYSWSTIPAAANGEANLILFGLINTVLPVISGTFIYPNTLSTTNGTWAGTLPITYTYQWNRNGTPIGGATSSTYALTAADVGNTITVTVTAHDITGSVPATSAAVGPIEADPVNTVAPVVTATNLSVAAAVPATTTNGTWTGYPAPTFTYQWYNTSPSTIAGATASSYTLQASDETYNVYCIVTGHNVAGTGTGTSNQVGPVTA
jgi:hypothetical protein